MGAWFTVALRSEYCPSQLRAVQSLWSTGFRAPGVNDLFSGVAGQFVEFNDPCLHRNYIDEPALVQQRCIAAGVPTGGYQQSIQSRSLSGGNPNLKPETSISRTAGFVYSPRWLPGFNTEPPGGFPAGLPANKANLELNWNYGNWSAHYHVNFIEGVRVYSAALAVGLFALVVQSAMAHELVPLTGIDAYIRHSMQAWHGPGLAIAVVKDGKIVMGKGFGVRTLGKPARVDQNTLFAITSNTKAFTAASLGMLVDAGKLKWDSRVEDYLKGFELYSPYETRVFDAYLGLAKTDWSKQLRKKLKPAWPHALSARAKRRQEALMRARAPRPKLSLPLHNYVGTYTDPLYGKVTISMAHEHLVLHRGRIYVGDLQSWDHDTFRVVWRYHFLGKDYCEFFVSPTGHVDKIRLFNYGTYERQK